MDIAPLLSCTKNITQHKSLDLVKSHCVTLCHSLEKIYGMLILQIRARFFRSPQLPRQSPPFFPRLPAFFNRPQLPRQSPHFFPRSPAFFRSLPTTERVPPFFLARPPFSLASNYRESLPVFSSLARFTERVPNFFFLARLLFSSAPNYLESRPLFFLARPLFS